MIISCEKQARTLTIYDLLWRMLLVDGPRQYDRLLDHDGQKADPWLARPRTRTKRHVLHPQLLVTGIWKK
jgi:hypothetical protein